jgi:hypothetical protein
MPRGAQSSLLVHVPVDPAAPPRSALASSGEKLGSLASPHALAAAQPIAALTTQPCSRTILIQIPRLPEFLPSPKQ